MPMKRGSPPEEKSGWIEPQRTQRSQSRDNGNSDFLQNHRRLVGGLDRSYSRRARRSEDAGGASESKAVGRLRVKRKRRKRRSWRAGLLLCFPILQSSTVNLFLFYSKFKIQHSKFLFPSPTQKKRALGPPFCGVLKRARKSKIERSNESIRESLSLHFNVRC